METVQQHLRRRHIDLALHRVWVDEVERIATFPMHNLSGQLVGYQQYRPDQSNKQARNDPKEGRYYSYLTKSDGKHPMIGVWGLESWYLSNALFICEGIFDAARLTERGVSAIAMISDDLDKSKRAWMQIVRSMRPVIAVCDNDAAGRKLAKHGTSAIYCEDKDLGDSSDQFVDMVVKHAW